MKRMLIGAAFLALSACTSAQVNDPTTVLAGVVSTFAGAVAGENLYLSSGKADPATVAQIEIYRKAADAVVSPLAVSAGQGNPPSSTQALAAQAAVLTLTQYMTSKGISVTGSN